MLSHQFPIFHFYTLVHISWLQSYPTHSSSLAHVLVTAQFWIPHFHFEMIPRLVICIFSCTLFQTKTIQRYQCDISSLGLIFSIIAASLTAMPSVAIFLDLHHNLSISPYSSELLLKSSTDPNTWLSIRLF